MSIEKNPEQGIEQYIAKIEKYEKNPIVQRVLAQDSSFEIEVEEFYDLSTSLVKAPKAGVFREFNFGQKNRSYPSDLVEILGSFSEEQFDITKLDYDDVREDYQRWENKSRQRKSGIIMVGGLLVASAGFVKGIDAAVDGNLKMAIPVLICGVGGVASYLWAMLKYPKPKGTNYEWTEYVKLIRSAEKADRFMDEHYRTHFIKKTLSKK